MKKWEEYYLLYILLVMLNFGWKNFSGILSVIMINMWIGWFFVVLIYLINIYFIWKLVEGLNMFNNEYCNGFCKISYLLVVVRIK